MPVSEACAVWVEQRVKEELEAGKGYREIGREIAAEIERVFETKVNPRTVEKRAERMSGATFVAPNPTAGDDCGKGGNIGNKLSPQDVVKAVDAEVKKGVSVREAAKAVAEKHGRNPGSLRVTYAREKERQDTAPVNLAISNAYSAIDKLNFIPCNDPDWEKALCMVRDWISDKLKEK